SYPPGPVPTTTTSYSGVAMIQIICRAIHEFSKASENTGLRVWVPCRRDENQRKRPGGVIHWRDPAG
ncbi:MAG: hypothetical protein O6942_04850, partial [Bacteroidetes bacterium]|nr:hypothetical protein [Bacteroidota bacterium]